MTQSLASLFNQALAVIQRAEIDVRDLNTKIDGAGLAKTCTPTEETNGKIGETAVKLVFPTQEVPIEIGLQARNSAERLWQGINTLTTEVAASLGDGGKKIPTSRSDSILKSMRVEGTVHELPEPLWGIVRKLEPYLRGKGEALWSVHELAICKSNNILELSANRRAMKRFMESNAVWADPPGWMIGQKEVILFRKPADSKLNQDIKIPADIILSRVQITEPKPLLEILSDAILLFREYIIELKQVRLD